jgi:hypothetical protein
MSTAWDRKPFHEVVIGFIKGGESVDLRVIGGFLLSTIIPKGHDEIIKAWEARCHELNWKPSDAVVVTESILKHKREIEEAEAKKKESAPHRRLVDDEWSL